MSESAITFFPWILKNIKIISVLRAQFKTLLKVGYLFRLIIVSRGLKWCHRCCLIREWSSHSRKYHVCFSLFPGSGPVKDGRRRSRQYY